MLEERSFINHLDYLWLWLKQGGAHLMNMCEYDRAHNRRVTSRSRKLSRNARSLTQRVGFRVAFKGI
jgi:hypothetical protein